MNRNVHDRLLRAIEIATGAAAVWGDRSFRPSRRRRNTVVVDGARAPRPAIVQVDRRGRKTPRSRLGCAGYGCGRWSASPPARDYASGPPQPEDAALPDWRARPCYRLADREGRPRTAARDTKGAEAG